MDKIIAIIPARMGSSRFPGKPLADINGKPMIQHVYERVKLCSKLDKVVVATCDKIIFDTILDMGGEAVMTSENHERASDRCAEALEFIENSEKEKYEIVVMVQGDEPMTDPEMINESLVPFDDHSVQVVNLLAEIKTKEEFEDPNCIKVVCDKLMNAIYFSRLPIPFDQSNSHPYHGKQVCIIPFRRNFLLEYINLEPTMLEISESIDMLRVIEHGYKVRMMPTKFETKAVDTIEDLQAVKALMSS